MTTPTDHHGGIDVTVKRPPLNERADKLGATVDRLDEAIKGLLHRLEPVLVASRPTPSMDVAGNSSGDDSWLAGYLDAITAKVDELGTVVDHITARVDL